MTLLPTNPFLKLFMLAVTSPLAFTLCMIAVTSAAIGAGYFLDSLGIGVIVWLVGVVFMSMVVM